MPPPRPPRCLGVTEQTRWQLECDLVKGQRVCSGCESILAATAPTPEVIDDINSFRRDPIVAADVVVGPVLHWNGSVEFCHKCMAVNHHIPRDMAAPETAATDHCVFCERLGVANGKEFPSGTACAECTASYTEHGRIYDWGDGTVLLRGDALFRIKSDNGVDALPYADVVDAEQVALHAAFLTDVGTRVSELQNISLLEHPLEEWTLQGPLKSMGLLHRRDDIQYGVAVHRRGPDYQVAIISVDHRGAVMSRAFKMYDEYTAQKEAWLPGDHEQRKVHFDPENYAATSTDFDEWLLLNIEGALAPQAQNC